MNSTYSYGGFVLNQPNIGGTGAGLYLIERPAETVQVQQQYAKIARLDGVKKSGEIVNQRTIPISIIVVGVSRADLENQLDALYAALDKRQQQLLLHTNDARYWICDAIYQKAKLGLGNIIKTQVDVTFVAQQPYALSAAGIAQDTSTVTLTLVSGNTYTLSPQSMPSLGNKFAYPTITIYNQASQVGTTLTSGLTSGTAYTSLAVAALSGPIPSGSVILLSYIDVMLVKHTQQVTTSALANTGDTSISVSSFVANYSYPPGVLNATSVVQIAPWSSLQLVQQPDNIYFAMSANLPQNWHDYITINCDPTVGWTVTANGGNTYLPFSGSFPLIEPTGTTLALTIVSGSSAAPMARMVVAWTPRWLS